MRMFLPLGVALSLAACSGGPPGGVLSVAVVGEGDMAADLAAEASRATLIRRGPAGELAPGLATSWRFLDDGNDLILRLAPARWPAAGDKRGPDLTARDVIFGLRRTGAEGRGALVAAGLVASDTARAPIARVVELSPRPATPLLLDWLAEPVLAVRDRRGRLFPGPYAAARIDDGWQLRRRDDGPRPDARAASINIQRKDAATAIPAFANGEVQLVMGEGLTGLGAARAAGQGRALKLESVQGVIGLSVNARSGPLVDARLRQALLLAVDRGALANRIGLALLTPQDRLWAGLPPADDDRARPADERRAMAAEALASAGFGPSQPLRLSLLVPAGPDYRALAETLAISLQPLGITIMVQTARGGGFAAARRSGQHHLALVEQAARVPDVVTWLAQWRCGRARPCSALADRLLEEAAVAGNDLVTRDDAAAAAETELMIDPAFIPLLRPVRWSLVASDLTGFETNLLGRHPLGRIAAGGR